MAGAVKSTNWRLLGEWALLFIVTTLIAVASFQQSFIQRIDASLLDFAAQATLAPPDESIVIVEIDDRTLDEIETWPWDRARHADLVTALSAMNPELIVMDILFLEPSEGEGDAQLADAIAQAGNVVLPHTFVQQPGQINGVIPAYPLDEFAAGASGIGHVAVGPDPDGVVRQIQLAIELESGDFPHLAAVTKNLAAPVSSAAETWPDNPVVPMQKAGSFRSISASEVLSQQVLPEFITGKIVLVGATAQGLGDRYAVASGTGQIIPGVEVQANTLDALLQDRLITAVPDRIAILILVLVLALLSIALWKLSPRWSLWTSVGLIAALLLGSMGMIIVAGKWLPVSAAILGIVIIYPLWGWRRLAAVSRFLQSEAEKFRSYAERKSTEDEEGFDTIARQVSLVKGLLGETRETLSFLRKVISASPDPMLVFDGAGQLVMQNSQADQLFGDADTNSPKNFDQMLAAKDVAKSASGKEITMPGGRVFLVAEAEFDVGDEGEVLTLRDITRIRRAEEERQQTLEFLSHDMRSPQAAIIGLTRKLGDSLEEKERLTRIEDQARRTLKLTEDFVQIARLENDGIQREETDIGAMLFEAADRAFPFAKRKGISIKPQVPEESDFCFVDASTITRVLDNLIGNALKYSPRGSEVHLGLTRTESGDLQIDVSDNGPGLPEEREKNPFARFGASKSHAWPSSGLGLAYVKKAIDEHGGTISVESKQGSGTRFTIVLPC